MLLRVPLHHAILEIRSHAADVIAHGCPRLIAIHDELGEIAVEDIADHLDQHVRLFVERHWLGALGAAGLFLFLQHVFPHVVQTVHILADVLLGGVLCSGTDDRSALTWDNARKNRLEALALSLWKLAGNTRGGATWEVHQVTAGKADARGQASALVTHGILDDLHHDLIAGTQRRFDAAILAVQMWGMPVHLTRVQHRVAAGAQVDERGFHAGQHVLHGAQVHVAHH